MNNQTVIVSTSLELDLPKNHFNNPIIIVSKRSISLKIKNKKHTWRNKKKHDSDFIISHHKSFKKILLALYKKLPDGINLLFIDDSYFRSLYLYISILFQCKYSIHIKNDEIAPIKNIEYAYFGGSQSINFDSKHIEQKFKTLYIGNYNGKTNSSKRKQETIKTSSAINKNQRRLLIVAYFSGECRSVGVQRVNYWYENIEALSKKTWEVDIATSIRPTKSKKNIHYVPDNNVFTLLEKSDFKLLPWMHRYHLIEKEHRASFNTLGHYWVVALERYFNSQKIEPYDAVIISGNPFSYFSFHNYCQLKWFSRIILDYRDPFANNPRFNYSKAALDAVRRVEQGFNFNADHIITVNSKCLDLVEDVSGVEKSIIRNGFDEAKLNVINKENLTDSQNKINFIHAGSIYPQCPPELLIESLESSKHKFHHIGSTEINYKNNFAYLNYGRQDYETTLSLISKAHCGVVFIPEIGFDTPTKLYDYLGQCIDLLVISAIPLEDSEIKCLLNNYKRVFYVRNNKESIIKFLDSYTPQEKTNTRNMQFSRKESTIQLIQLLNKLVN